MSIQTGFKSRPYAGEDDLQPVADLFNVISLQDNLQFTLSAANVLADIGNPEFDKGRDFRLWEDSEGRLAGFGQVQVFPPGKGEGEHPEEMAEGRIFSFRARPDVRGRGLEGEILDWAEGRIQEAAAERGLPGRIFAGAPDTDAYGRGILEGRGYTPARYFFRMSCPLEGDIPEPKFPEGITLSHNTTSLEDTERWVDAYNNSFVDHWNHHPITVEAAKSYSDLTPDYREDLDLIAVAPDGKVAGFCYCEVMVEDNARMNRNDGWIHLLGTRRGYRGIGLGRALLLAGLRILKENGADTAKLGVDADNPTGALGLYESVGFRTISTNMVYQKVL